MQSALPDRKMSQPLPSQAHRAAALLDREAHLLEERRFLGPASYRRQLEIDAELLDIRDDLERLAWTH
jgi:hypothetical protein